MICPNVSKSWFKYASSIRFKRSSTIFAARNWRNGLVDLLVSIPEVDEISFSLSLTTKITARSSGQWFSSATWTAIESFPSGLLPFSQRTKPPYKLLDALPEPCLAIDEICPGYSSLTAKSLASEATKHANPAADDARPAPVGNVLTDEIWTLYCGQSSLRTIISPVFGSTLSPASARSSRRHAIPRLLIFVSTPFNQSLSSVKFLLAATVVNVCKSFY